MKPYLPVVLAYTIFGALWIFLSDRLVAAEASDLAGVVFWQTMKGWLFIVLSSLLLLALTKRAFERQQRLEREKLMIFNKTVEGSYHILLNYLNQMQLVTMEAEQCAGFDARILELAHAASSEATAELMKLRDIQTVTAEHIHAVIYENLRKRANGAE
ncbi:MAG: hypothetical protein JF599_02255 [Verrucomicrobia bacterium]|nr:hypothetical protein [Verrucomicrobiota bacterium]